LYVKINDIDVYAGMREEQLDISGADVTPERRRESIAALGDAHKKQGIMGWTKAAVTSVF
jgi:amino acid transporter